MNILAVDTSSQAASCALLEDDCLVAEYFSNAGLTHSQTIMPMVETMLLHCRRTLQDMDAFAVSNGPGSFTGLRIGIGAVKGMAMALNKSCIPVSTLLGLAYNLLPFRGYILSVMDARCAQVYAGLFQSDGQSISRIWQDEAQPLTQVEERLREISSPVMVAGDGAKLCADSIDHPLLRQAPPTLLHQRAGSVAMAAREIPGCTAQELAPAYFRLPQAQRELEAKQKLKSN